MITTMTRTRGKKRLTLRISQRHIFAFFLVFNYIPIYAIRRNMDTMVPATISGVELAILVLYCIIRRKKLNGCVYIWAAYCIALCFSTLLNNGNVLYAAYYYGNIFGFFILNSMFLEERDLTLLQVIRHIFSVLLVITFLQQMIDQDAFGYTPSMNYQTFFESDNYLVYYYMPFIAVCVVLDMVEVNRVRGITYAEILICFLSVVRSWSVKSIVGIGCVIVYALFVYRKKIAKILSIKFAVILYVIIYTGVLFFSVQNFIPESVFQFFGKNATFTGRTTIWASAFENIRNSPIYGYGVPKNGLLQINAINRVEASSHNLFLESTIQSGFIGLTIFILFIAYSLYRASKAEKKYHQCQYEFLFVVFILFIMFSMAIASNPVTHSFFYLPLILLASFESILEIRNRVQGITLNYDLETGA